jgi:epoxyqueuosine reductase
MDLTQEIKQKALKLGFDLVGITDALPIDKQQEKALRDWLQSGFAGQMAYMHRNIEKRIDPAGLLENAQSVICVGLNYTPQDIVRKINSPVYLGRVSNYALYEDYHSFIKSRLNTLIDFIHSIVNSQSSILNFKVCVDSAPLAERALAVRAGLGFIGKNHILINPHLGCQIFLGEIITTLKLQPSIENYGLGKSEVENHCSNCNKCIAACPTGALRPDGQFDANRCISYLTIEYKGRIPPALAAKIGSRLFGCDECILACPWQKKAPPCKNKQFKFYGDRAEMDLNAILNMTQDEFAERFAGSCIERLALDGLKRNAQIGLS